MHDTEILGENCRDRTDVSEVEKSQHPHFARRDLPEADRVAIFTAVMKGAWRGVLSGIAVQTHAVHRAAIRAMAAGHYPQNVEWAIRAMDRTSVRLAIAPVPRLVPANRDPIGK